MAADSLRNCSVSLTKFENCEDTVGINTLEGIQIKTENIDEELEVEIDIKTEIKSEYDPWECSEFVKTEIKSEYDPWECSEFLSDSELENMHGEIISEVVENEDELEGEIIKFEEQEDMKNDSASTTNSLQGQATINSELYRKLRLCDEFGRMSCYLCEFCGIHKKWLYRLYPHYKINLDSSLLETLFETTRKKLLTKHIEAQHTESRKKKHLCDKCPYQTDVRYQMMKHQISHSIYSTDTARKNYKCPDCDYQTRKKFYLDQHRKVHADKSELEYFNCKLCDYRSIRQTNLNNHMKVHKKLSEVKSFDCELCKYRTKYPHLLRNHIKTNHKNFPKSLIRTCEKCDFETNNKYSLETHMASHRKKQPIKYTYVNCNLCEFKTRRKERLKYHLSRVHADVEKDFKKFECHDCGHKTMSKRTLKHHIILKHLLNVLR